ncbi:unnamed protein product [Parascedosporium putredinis]|uniref:Uncharacterized protein n=1 Tax=Parascedosporium putredinis TaxID=1442378 RepID=A0A9P1GYI4_9PEZI|nr:unnamed protein product [Parascedosporium putredinis]CAI7990777.1 unnamed protein product [Parascedosporium putredinis]
MTNHSGTRLRAQWAGATLDGNLLVPLASFVLRANDFLRQEGLAHYWLTIRATQATPEYDCPRWHCDEYFFHEAERPDKGPNWWANHLPHASRKERRNRAVVPTANGLETVRRARRPPRSSSPNQQSKARQIRDRVRASCAKEHICASVRCVGCATAAEEVRKRLGEEYAGLGTVQAAKGQIACFRVGTARGAVHSEPKMDGDRIFVNVVPGTEDELRALSSRWGWSIRGHGAFGLWISHADSE